MRSPWKGGKARFLYHSSSFRPFHLAPHVTPQQECLGGRDQGHRINSRRQLLHQVFADDTCIFMESFEENYRKISSLVSLYERISRALLNLNKSMLIQLNNGPSLGWFNCVGCRVVLRGEVIKYLGCPIGFNIPPSKILCFLLDIV